MIKMLCIDDEKTLANAYKMYFDSKGIQTHTAYTKGEAIEKLKTILPDIAIIDIELEECHGVDLLLEAKTIKPDIKTIIVTGLVDETLQKQAQEKGVDIYLEKPFTLQVLDGYVQSLINKIQTERNNKCQKT